MISEGCPDSVLPACELSAPPFASCKEEGREGQERAAVHIHHTESGCCQSGMAQPPWKLAGLGLGRTQLSPAGLHKCLSCCCQVRKTQPFSQRRAASAVVGYLHLVKMAMSARCFTFLSKMRTLLVCPLPRLQNLAINISVEMPLCTIFLVWLCLTLFVGAFFPHPVKVRDKTNMCSTSSVTS